MHTNKHRSVDTTYMYMQCIFIRQTILPILLHVYCTSSIHTSYNGVVHVHVLTYMYITELGTCYKAHIHMKLHV